MKRWLPTILLSLATTVSLFADDPAPVAHDDASQSAYGSSWSDASNGGAGFAAWSQKTLTGSGNSNAGFYLASASDHPDLTNAADSGKAFGIFANGVAFESAAAFRGISAPLTTGQSFTVKFQAGAWAKKFDTDSDSTGSLGITLRSGNEAGGIDDYNKNARFEFGAYQNTPNYQIYDGQDDHDTGIPFSEGGVKIKLTLTGADTYDIDITTLADKKTKTLTGRKLGGTAGGTLDSLCIFDRNWEKNDAFFNDLAVLPMPATAPAASATPAK